MATITRPASQKQIDLIARLLDEKDITDQERSTIEFDVDNNLSTRGASQWIDFLFARRRRPAQQELAVDAGPVRAKASEEGFYALDGKVYKVVTARTTGNLYAKETSAAGLLYAPGVMGKLFADQKLSGEQIVAAGLEAHYCIVCSTEFEDPTSKHIGIGPSCGPKTIGKDAYKALRLSVADKPDVIAFEAAKKVAAKARREAKKAEEAQLVLV